MKSIYKKGAALAAAALMTVAFAGCGGGDKSASKGPKDTLTVGITNFADSLEPTDNYFGWQVMRYGVGECLVHFDSKMNAEPWIAESWKVSDDKMSWTFKIKDIKFSNGTPVTGEAVKNPSNVPLPRLPVQRPCLNWITSLLMDRMSLFIRKNRLPHFPACWGIRSSLSLMSIPMGK